MMLYALLILLNYFLP